MVHCLPIVITALSMSGECCAHLCVCPGTALSYNEQRAGPCTLLHSLHCPIHYCTLLYITALGFTLLQCTLLCYTVYLTVVVQYNERWAAGGRRKHGREERKQLQGDGALHCIVLYWSSALCCTALYWSSALHCTTEISTALYYSALQ